LRLARAAVFAALCSTLSSTSHVLLSRAPLPLPLVAAVFLAMAGIAFAGGRRERGFRAIAALLVPLELAADTLFTTGQRTCYGPAGGPVTGPLRSIGADVVCDGGRVGSSLAVPGAVPTDPALPWLLLAAHVAVGLLASWWLRRGEAALQRTLRAAATLTFRPLARAAAVLGACCVRPRRRLVQASAAGPRAVRSRPFSHSVVRRGPPSAVAA
jgi:hypothetical protein